MKKLFSGMGWVGALLFGSLSQGSVPVKGYPASPSRSIVDEYHGVQVTDAFQWLEDSSSQETKDWTQAQSSHARKALDGLSSLPRIRARLEKWNRFKSPSYRAMIYRGGIYFALKLAPPKNQAVLVSMTSLDDLKTERVVLDPNRLDSSGTTAIDFFEPSLDGSHVAVSLSKGGSESGTLSVWDTRTAKSLPERISRVNNPTAGGSVTWNRDGTGFFYTRYPKEGERAKEDLDFYQQIYFHKLGTALAQDSYSLGKDFPRIAEIELQTSEDGSHILATVANGDGGEYSHHVLGPNGKWVQITQFKDRAKHGVFGQNNDLFLVSLEDAPRGKVLRIPLATPDLTHAQTVVAEGEGVIQEVLPTHQALYVSSLLGGPSEVRIYDLEGKPKSLLPVPALSTVSNLLRGSDDRLVFKSQSYVLPPSWFSYSSTENVPPRKTSLVTLSPVSFADIEVSREVAVSKDGTKIPLTVLSKKGLKRDGKSPALLYGYGGYGISLTPYFKADLHLWLERGGVYAVANIRGGGEFGDSWHLNGNLVRKQNVFDDFIACAEHLVTAKIADPSRLAIEGGSNGGLLMGAVMTQKPGLFRAVVSHVGIYDMLRVERDPNGSFNVTEFGTVKDPAQFKALYAYSPFHHVVDGTAYPAVLLLTGANDGRVNPYHSKKMAARLQTANPAGKPVLLRVTFDGGHGVGKSVSQKVAEEADVFAFLFDQLGM